MSYQAAKELFAAVCELPAAERSEFLDRAGVEPVVRQEVESLLEFHVEGDRDDAAGLFARSSSAAEPGRAVSAPPKLKYRPQRLGRYTIEGELGTGGFGVVFRARDTLLKRSVAIKACTSPDPALRRRFTREAEICARLRHVNIITVYDVGEHEGVPYLVQELLTGHDLSHMLEQGTDMPMAERLRVLRCVADGLAYAHGQGVVHRDVTPSNVRVTDRGEVRLLDFGIAHLAQHPKLTDEGMAMGTLGYLAPEQLRAETVDARADVFAFGALAYEWLCGRPAFPGRAMAEVAGRLLFEDVDPEPLAEQGLGPGMQELIIRCLCKEPDARFADGQELSTALAELGSGRDRAWSRESRRSVVGPWATWAAVLALGGAVAVGALRWTGPVEEIAPGSVVAQAARRGPGQTVEASESVAAGATEDVAAGVTEELEPAISASPPEPARPSTSYEPEPSMQPISDSGESAQQAPAQPREPVFTPGSMVLPLETMARPTITTRPTKPEDLTQESDRPFESGRDAESEGDEARLLRPEVPALYVGDESGLVPPRLIESQEPVYPRRARRRLATSVVVGVLVDARGRVEQTVFVRRDKSGLGFNRAAEEAARGSRFEPATVNGVPGKMWTRLEFDFRP